MLAVVLAIAGAASAILRATRTGESWAEGRPVPVEPRTRAFTAEETAQFRALHPEIAPDSSPVAHGRTLLANRVWSITTYRNRRGDLCGGVALPAEGQGSSCYDRKTLFRDGPVWAAWGGRQPEGGDLTRWDVVWIEGFAAPSVRNLELIATDCSRTPIAVDRDGVFLHLIPGQRLDSGEWPYELVAYGTDGKALGRRRIAVTAPRPGDPREAQGTGPGASRANCP